MNVARRGHRQRDHYYWLTSYLASRGAQTTVCRVIAVGVFAFGTAPILVIVSGQSLPGWPVRVVAGLVALCCLTASWVWTRHCWPSRRQSQACVVGGTACIAATCLITADALVGLIGCTCFVMATGYGALFHSARLLATIALATVGTVAVLVWRSSDADASAVAVSAVAAAVLANVFTAFTARMVIRLVDIGEYDGDIEPVTGLLTRAAFLERAANLIGARSRGDDRHLVIVAVTVERAAKAADSDRANVAMAGKLRHTLRRGAVIAHVGAGGFLIADLFTSSDPEPLLQRIRGTIAAPPARRTASLGVVSLPLGPLAAYPSPEVLEEMMSLAGTASAAVAAAGGDGMRVHADPPLSVLGAAVEPDYVTSHK